MASFATLNRSDISMAFSKIKLFNFREKLPGTVAIVSGLLVSLWTQCVLIVICIQGDYYGFQHSERFIEKMIIMYGQITYCVIMACGIAGMCYGLKNRDKKLVYLWLATKVFETIVSLVGIILLATYGRFVGLLFPALVCLLAGFYLSLCGWQTIKNMSEPSPPSEEAAEDLQKVIDEKPPSYDNFTNQA